jgi:transcriptional regulator with XRE-family HTH domain
MRDALALAELREARGVTQSELAAAMHVTQRNVSRVEHEDDVYLSTLSNYVAALGGRLKLAAEFPDVTITFAVPPTADQDATGEPQPAVGT